MSSVVVVRAPRGRRCRNQKQDPGGSKESQPVKASPQHFFAVVFFPEHESKTQKPLQCLLLVVVVVVVVVVCCRACSGDVEVPARLNVVRGARARPDAG